MSAVEAVVTWDGRRDGPNRGLLLVAADVVRMAGPVYGTDLPDYRDISHREDGIVPAPAARSRRSYYRRLQVDAAVEHHWSLVTVIIARSQCHRSTVQMRLKELLASGAIERTYLPSHKPGGQRALYRRARRS